VQLRVQEKRSLEVGEGILVEGDAGVKPKGSLGASAS